MSADGAQPEVDPVVAHLQALLAALRMRLDVLDLIQMTALCLFSFSSLVDGAVSELENVYFPERSPREWIP